MHFPGIPSTFTRLGYHSIDRLNGPDARDKSRIGFGVRSRILGFNSYQPSAFSYTRYSPHPLHSPKKKGDRLLFLAATTSKRNLTADHHRKVQSDFSVKIATYFPTILLNPRAVLAAATKVAFHFDSCFSERQAYHNQILKSGWASARPYFVFLRSDQRPTRDGFPGRGWTSNPN